MNTSALRALFLTAIVITLGCMKSMRHPSEPALLAYWQLDRRSPVCPINESCFAVLDDIGELQALVESQARKGLHLIRFDARTTRSEGVYAGAWARTDRAHFWEPDLERTTFLSAHRRHSEQGHRLVHLNVYDTDVRPLPVSAIWREGDDEDESSTRERVVWDTSWEHLVSLGKDLDGYFLAEIEIYPAPHDPQTPMWAGVFRPGDVETRLIADRFCRISSDPVELEPCDHGQRSDTTGEDLCQVFSELAGWAEQGFRPVDFERYEKFDQDRLAVLFHRTEHPDWLLVPAGLSAGSCRYDLLNSSPLPDPVLTLDLFSLVDLDLIPTRDPGLTHEGLVHDGGTSGPPP